MSGSVLIVGNFLSGSLGTRGVCEDLSARLTSAGWRVLTTSDRPGRVARLLDMVSTAWRRRHAYSIAQVDVYSGPAFTWAEAVCATLRLARKPYVLTLHGGNLPAFAARRPLRVRRLLRSAAAVTTPSRYLLEQMRPYRDDLHLIPNALDLDAYEFRPRERPAPRLVWLRAFHEIYNPAMAVEVVARLAGDFPDVHLTMVGPDKGDGSLQRTKARARQLGVAGRVTFAGAVTKVEVPAWLQRGDIFLNTTNVDNTPVSVIEAMTSGLCVVSTDVGGIPYLLHDGCDALLVPATDVEATALAVKKLLHDPDMARRLSEAARVVVEAFSWSKVLPQWNLLLQRGIADFHARRSFTW